MVPIGTLTAKMTSGSKKCGMNKRQTKDLQKQSLDMVNNDMSLGRLKSCLQNITSKIVVGIIIVNTEAYFEKCLLPSSIYVI